MEIKRLYNDNEFDIFLGSGWENWIRVKVGRNKQVECLAKAEHVQLNDKLAELIYYKTRRYS
jgi:hypothetical protein